MLKEYPELLQPKYLINLDLKQVTLKYPPYNYTSKRVLLTGKQSDSLLNLINSSGYWQLPPRDECMPTSTHSGAFSLEANTKNKYKYVIKIDCDDDTSKFKQACKALVKYAGMEKEIFPTYDDKCSIMLPSIPDVPLEQPKRKREH